MRVAQGCFRPVPLKDRFWKHVRKGDGCWGWIGVRTSTGYGRVTIRHGKYGLAHRVAWTLIHGEIPAGLQVCHSCDNPPCVRPDHLWVGTQQDNVDDMIRKGRKVQRNLRGEEHGRAINSARMVKRIRAMWSVGRKSYVGPAGKKHTLGKYPKRAIAEKLRVTYSLVVSALNNWEKL